jgi:hypothetical protein
VRPIWPMTERAQRQKAEQKGIWVPPASVRGPDQRRTWLVTLQVGELLTVAPGV